MLSGRGLRDRKIIKLQLQVFIMFEQVKRRWGLDKYAR